MLKKFTGVFLLTVLLFAMLCGCRNNKSDVSSAATAPGPENTQSSTAPADDLNDPENTENINGTGTKVTAENLAAATGKANGIDVSKWQGKIDWKAVKNAGIDFAVIRIGYRAENGKIYKDAYADYNIQQADKAGILIGIYFFSTAINKSEAEEEAKWVTEAIGGYPISYPIAYNCEGFTLPDSRMYGISNSQRTDNALAFLSYIEGKGYEGMLYAAKSELEGSVAWDTARIEQNYRVWVAHYSSVTYPQKQTPDYSGKFDMWQYTNMGRVSGINGNCDMVVSYFTKEKAAPKSNKAPEEVQPPQENNTVYTAVSEQVTAKELVNLRDAASTKSNIIGTLKNGETLSRTGIGSNGWSRLSYNGKTVYAITSYITTDLSYTPPATEQPTDSVYSTVNEQVTAKDVTNLRSVAGSKDSSTIVYALKNGELVTRTGIGSNGWSRLIYNGQTVYAITSYLTTDLTPKTPENESSEPVVSQSDGFTTVNEQVTAKAETNLRSEPSTKSSDTVVYTLKNGEYITRIGINEATGWSKLIYNGQTVYAITSYLTVE